MIQCFVISAFLQDKPFHLTLQLLLAISMHQRMVLVVFFCSFFFEKKNGLLKMLCLIVALISFNTTVTLTHLITFN